MHARLTPAAQEVALAVRHAKVRLLAQPITIALAATMAITYQALVVRREQIFHP